MSRLQELLDQYCPDGVEKKRIADIASYEQPGKYLVSSTDYRDEFDTPVLTAGQTFVLGYTDEKTGIYPASKDDPVIIFDDFTGAFKWVDFPFKAKSSAMKMIKARGNIVLLRYLYHMMGFLNYTSDEHKRLWISMYSEFEVPVPPIEVQREVVRILDSFTELTTELATELTTELDARRKQYEYYRDTLLDFDNADPNSWLGKMMAKYCPDGVHYEAVGDLAVIGTGSSDRKNAVDDGVYPFYVRSKEVLRSNRYLFDETAIVIPGEGGVGDIFHFVEGKYDLHQRAYRISFKDKAIEPKYAYYCFCSLFKRYIMRKSVDATVTSIRKPMIEDFPIPVPPLELQREIVKVLDRFSSLCSDVSEGLPAEIAARQKQYEYYRDRLLSF